jgi:signal transduction histidine kinase
VQLFERSPIAMYRARGGEVIAVNAALARLLGFETADELMTSELRAQLATPRGWKRRDGKDIAVQISTETIDGDTFAWILDDGNDGELRRTSTILDMCMRLMPAIYWIMDRDLRIVRVGGAVEPILGYATNTFVGSTLHEVERIESGSRDPIVDHQRALAGEQVTTENLYRGKLLQNTLGPFRDASGEIIGVIGTCIDATATRALEQRMIDAQRAESLGVLAGGLAHDFNNLLVAVIGSADIALRDLPATSLVRTTIENIRIAGLRAAELVEQLLAYAGRGGRGTKRVMPADLVEELLRIVAPSLERVETKVDIPKDVALRGDPAQVRQVLLNLIVNARDALGANGGSIAIAAHTLSHPGDPDTDADVILAAPAGDYLAISVADNGPGFDRETRRHVFEPFWTTKVTGHGLGLAAVLGIVRAHGGGIRVRSTPGHGATFEILWPAANPRARSNPPSPPPITRDRTVLVVDDEDLVRDVVARMIEELGYAAITAADGPSALALLENHPVDAVLVDLTMPHMSGADVITAVRARRPGLPVVLCSGFDRSGRGSVAADAYLPKPFRIDALERTLAKLLPLRSV